MPVWIPFADQSTAGTQRIMTKRIVVHCELGVVQGDVKKLTDDVAALKPTLFVAVPRVLERIQQGIQGRLRSQNPVVQFAFQAAYSWKRFWMKWGWSASDVSPSWLHDVISRPG